MATYTQTVLPSGASATRTTDGSTTILASLVNDKRTVTVAISGTISGTGTVRVRITSNSTFVYTEDFSATFSKVAVLNYVYGGGNDLQLETDTVTGTISYSVSAEAVGITETF